MSVVVASWVLVLLAAFGVNYAHDVIGEARLVQLEYERHQLRAWARSGIELARLTLEATPRTEHPGLGYADPANPLAFPLACGVGHFAVGQPLPADDTGHWRPGLGDEGSRLPVALMDSISLGFLPGMTAHGIKTLMQAQATADGTRLPPFALLADLDDPSRECADQFLSRYGASVNINTASHDVLLALGLPRRAVDKMLRWRSGDDAVTGTADDRHFFALDTGNATLRACALNSEEAAVVALLQGSGRLAVSSRFFGLVSRGWGDNCHGICEIHVVIERPDRGPVQILEWSENWLN